MPVEFFDAAMPLPQGAPWLITALEGIAPADDSPTLDMALKRISGAGLNGGSTQADILVLDPGPHDLWISALEVERHDGGRVDPVDPRPLNPDELALISGGRITEEWNNPPDEDEEEIIVEGPPPYEPDYWDENPYDQGDNDPNPDGGGGGGGDGQSGGPEEIDLTGRDCPVDQAAARAALNSLYANSATARALIDAMVARDTDLNLIAASLSISRPGCS